MASVSLTQQAYRHIQQGIISGQLSAGSVVSELRLAKQLGISRTPVGEAIRQLAQEGLVEQVPRFGTIVREIDRRLIEELYELREALEPYAVRQAAGRITSAQLAQLRLLCATLQDISRELEAARLESLDEEMLKRFLAADLAFHLLIMKAAGNARMLSSVRETRTISQIFRMHRTTHDSDIVTHACADHQAIVDALVIGDGEAAAAVLLRHIKTSKVQTLAYMKDRRRAGVATDESTLALPREVQEELERLEQLDD